MILSHKYRFIFLKTAKTAGTSVEIALSKHLGEDDIITPISAPDELIRRQLGYRGPQNFRIPFRGGNIRRVASALLSARGWPKFYNHISSREVRLLIGEQTWNSYYKFCFERNPFDRVISLYFWRHKSEPRPSLAEFLDDPEVNLLTTRGIGIYTDASGQISVNKVGRYENLTEDLEAIRKQVGIPEPLQLPQAKASHRTDKRHYSELIDDTCRMKIQAGFERELKLFGYQF